MKDGIVKKTCGKLLANAKDVRENSDYGDFTIVTKEEAKKQIENATLFIKETEKALKDIWKGK